MSGVVKTIAKPIQSISKGLETSPGIASSRAQRLAEEAAARRWPQGSRSMVRLRTPGQAQP